MAAFSRRGLLVIGTAGLVVPCRLWAAADPAPVASVRSLIDALLAIMKQGRAAPFEDRVAALAPVIDSVFDLDAILKASTGSGYAGLKPAEWDALRTAFRDYTIASYVHSFAAFNGQRFEIAPDVRTVGNGEQVVRTRIVPADGDPHDLDYVMRSDRGGWRVVDVLADGSVSRVAVQRSDFRRLLTQGGAAALIGSLQAKTAELATP